MEKGSCKARHREGVRRSTATTSQWGGVPFPATIELTDRQGVQVKISFDEPEVNAPVDDGALTPKLEGVTILPLARLAEAYSSR